MVPRKRANTSSKARVLDLLRRPRGRPATAEGRVQPLQDDAEVRNLIVRYAHLQDFGPFDDLLALCSACGLSAPIDRARSSMSRLARPIVVP
jgi:hypothetical protein